MRGRIKADILSLLDDVSLFALASGFMVAVYNSSDTHILTTYFQDESSQTIGSFVYLIIGSWIGVLITFLLGIGIGHELDNRFQGWQIPRKKPLILAFLSGSSGAVATFCFLLGLSQFNPSLVIILMVGSILGQTFIDVYQKNLAWKKIVPSVVVVISGSILASTSFEEGFSISLWAILLIFILRNSFDVLSVYAKQVGVRPVGQSNEQSIDTVNFQLWRFIFLALIGTLTSIVWVLIRGEVDLLLNVLQKGFFGAIPFIILTMFCNFCSGIWESRALQKGQLSLVNILLQSRIFFGLMITYLVIWIFPNSLGRVETEPLSVLLKVFGGVLVFIGIILLIRGRVLDVGKTK